MNYIKYILLAGLLMDGRTKQIDLTIPTDCIKSVILVDCQMSNPPKCRTAKIEYKYGCEQISLK
jgi:hypothetical protein